MLIELDLEDFIKYKENKCNSNTLKNNTKILVVFKIFHEKTPNLLTRQLFHRNNTLPIKDLSTRIEHGDHEDGTLNNLECLVYYYFNIIPPKVELHNTLFIYRQGLDPEFDQLQYLNTYSKGIKEVKTLNNFWSKYMVDVLNDFIKNPEKYNL
jgi:hypothetical protein